MIFMSKSVRMPAFPPSGLDMQTALVITDSRISVTKYLHDNLIESVHENYILCKTAFAKKLSNLSNQSEFQPAEVLKV